MKTKNINLRITAEVYCEIEKIAEQEETSISAIIRKAIKEFLKKNEKGKEQNT